MLEYALNVFPKCNPYFWYDGSSVPKENKKKRSSVDLSTLSQGCVVAFEQRVIILFCTAYYFFHVVNDRERVEKY